MRGARTLLLRTRRAALPVARALVRPVAHHLRAWQARRAASRPTELALDDVRRRLELLVTALHGRPIAIEREPLPRRKSLVERLIGVQALAPPLAASDGERIHLPAGIDASGGGAEAIARYRLLALAQAERIVRGTAGAAPPALPLDPAAQLERDLYLVAESAAVDAALARTTGGLRRALADARARALRARPALAQFPPVKRAVERLVRQALGDDGAAGDGAAGDGAAPLALPDTPTPAASREWARATAARLCAISRGYGGVPAVDHWGTVLPPRTVAGGAHMDEQGATGKAQGPKSGVVGRVKSDADGDAAGSDGGAASPPDESSREGRPGRGDLASPDGAPLDPADAASRVIERADASAGAGAPVLATYAEWHHFEGRLMPRAVTVRERVAPEGSSAWATEALAAHAALVGRVRERFERLRSRRLRLPRQRDGDELDLDAVARALVDRRLGHAIDDRLFVAVHPGRRGLAIALLVDVSGSTESRVTATERVIDVEKEAVLLASEAFDALGDRYAVLAFSGHGARDVRVGMVKAFGERNRDAVRRRIAGMVPDGNTRLGAAIRHAAALLERESAGHRLLLILSDGKPNDVDHYLDRYAVEDSRRAVLDARAGGIHLFCLTVDREEGHEYLPRIFGTTGYAIMRQPGQLPGALLGVVRAMLGGR